MRGVEVDSKTSGPDLVDAVDHSIIHSLCQEWLMRIELNLTDSEITFEAVKWAISKLQCIEEQERFQGYDSNEDTAESSSSRIMDGVRGDSISGQSSNRQRFGAVDRGRRSENFANGDEVECFLRGPRVNLLNWRNMLVDAIGCMDEAQQGNRIFEGDCRARARQYVFPSALKEAVIAAEGRDAGKRTAQRVNSRLDLPDRVSLTKLVSHCLLVSLDQTPTNVIRPALATVLHSSSTANEETSDWIWLHRWFVRTLLPCRSNNYSSHIGLDWLVAYMTASRGTITKLVLHDLIVDLHSLNDSGEQPPLATYIRRTRVLGYAALRWN